MDGLLLPAAPSIASRLQATLGSIPGALGSISISRARARETLKTLFYITLAAAALIVIGHAVWRGGGGHVVASLVVRGSVD